LGDAQIGEQERDRFEGPCAAAVGVDGQLITADVLLGGSLLGVGWTGTRPSG
jgi:hypothetical protein